MKKILAMLVCFLVCISLIFSLAISASAASTVLMFSANTVKPGETVTVTVRLNANVDIYDYDFTLTYDPTILEYVSGGSKVKDGTLENSATAQTSQGKSVSCDFTFKALKDGTSSMYAYTEYAGGDHAMVEGGEAGAPLKVVSGTTPPPTTSQPETSTPAETEIFLSSLKLGAATLTPAFSKDVTEYSLTVENSVEKLTIEATTDSVGAAVTGAGEVTLEVGDNKFTVTVTSSDKKLSKTYTLNIRRATLEEGFVSNPAVTLAEKPCHIKASLSDVTPPEGFTVKKATYGETTVDVLCDSENKYEIYVILDDANGTSDYYVYNEIENEFEKLNYMTVNGQLIIFASLPENCYPPEGYYETAVTLGNGQVKVFCYEDYDLSDIYVIYCYQGGNYQFYRFDTKETTLQRALDFEPSYEPPVQTENILDEFKALDNRTKIFIYIIAGEALVIILLAVLAIIGFKGRSDAYEEEYEDDEEDEIIDNNDAMENFLKMVNTPRHSQEETFEETDEEKDEIEDNNTEEDNSEEDTSEDTEEVEE